MRETPPGARVAFEDEKGRVFFETFDDADGALDARALLGSLVKRGKRPRRDLPSRHGLASRLLLSLGPQQHAPWLRPHMVGYHARSCALSSERYSGGMRVIAR